MFFLIKRIRAHLGHDKYSAETFDRLLHSMHVEDLDWVVSVTTYAAAIAIALIFGADYFGGSKLYESLVHASAVLAVLGAVVAWCYQTGSSRLGMVDLFACEITTLCRICTINGLADTCIAAFGPDIRYDKDKIIKIREQFGVFTSSETYTPFFDANAKELHSLSVKVLANITAFYTYWKATRDAFRKLADIQTHDGWHRVMCDIMYMQFLAFESARKAVRDLIEFEPNNAENKITIFISELPLYGFLLKHFQPGDLRHARLKLRQKRYEVVVPQVYYHTEDEHAKYKDAATARKQMPHLAEDDLEELCRDWNKAYEMLDELKSRYEAAIGKFPPRGRTSDSQRPVRGR